MTWKPISEYPTDGDGIGPTVAVAWRRDAGRVIRMASGFRGDGIFEWMDYFAGERLETPDYWFELPPIPL
jgi:hypothetical protein